MSDCTNSHWHIYGSIYSKPYQDVEHYFVVPDDYEHGRDFYIAAVLDRKDAILIAAVPEMYKLLKALAKSSNNVEVGNVVLARKKLLSQIDEILVCIDGKEVQS